MDLAWSITRKAYAITAGIFPVRDLFFQKQKYNFEEIGILKFLRTENVIITCGDGNNIVKQYQNNTNCLLLLDPPYIMSFNDFYTNDETNIYEYFFGTDLCFIRHSYGKTYHDGIAKKKLILFHLIDNQQWVFTLILYAINAL